MKRAVLIIFALLFFAASLSADEIKKGTTDKSIFVMLRSTSDGDGVSGIAHSGITARYLRQGGTVQTISGVNLAAIDSAHSDGGWEEADATNMTGAYRFDLPDAALASGADSVLVTIEATGAATFAREFSLVDNVQGDVFASDGTAQAVTSTTITLASGNSYGDDALNRNYVICVQAATTGVGQCEDVTDFVASTDVATIANAWGTTPTGTVEYVLKVVSEDESLSASEVNTEVDTAIETYHLDHLLAADYDPSSKPGTATALLNELVENDGGVSRYSANALEQGPSGSGATPAEVRTQVDNSIEAYHLDHLLAVDYNPASKPGVGTALLNELIEDDSGVSRYTVNALEQGPSGGGGGAAGIWGASTSDYKTPGTFGGDVLKIGR